MSILTSPGLIHRRLPLDERSFNRNTRTGMHSQSTRSRHRDWRHSRTVETVLGWQLELEQEQHEQRAPVQLLQQRRGRRREQRAARGEDWMILLSVSCYILRKASCPLTSLNILEGWFDSLDVIEGIASWVLMLFARVEGLFIPESDSHDLFMKNNRVMFAFISLFFFCFFLFLAHILKSC